MPLRAYWPSSAGVVMELLAVLCAVLVGGFLVQRFARVRLAGILAWLLAITAVLYVERRTVAEGAGLRMSALILVLLVAMKAVVAVAARRDQPPLGVAAWLRFASWFGMRPAVFVARGERFGDAPQLFWRGVRRMLAGLLCVLVATLLARYGSVALATPLLLVGLSLVLHFGVFNVLAGIWRARGFDCRALFRAPLWARGPREFWSRRWNLGFSQMTAQVIYRPLCARWGRGPALWAAFLFSGALHELAISVPVRAGYGGPFVYFVVQALGVVAEERRPRRTEAAGNPAAPVLLWVSLLLPLPLLFHPPFLAGVVWPLLPGGS